MAQSAKITPILIHTGQHYDEKMSKTFFVDLEMPEPNLYLGVGSGSHAQQTADVMVKMEAWLIEHRPDLLVVVGDVNSTLAASLAASKVGVSVAHVEAGLRSYDRTMPEEINRLVTDAVADHLFVTEQSGLDNLRREGVDARKIHFVGNVMIDSLVAHLEKASMLPTLDEFGVSERAYALMTLHRPSNVDSAQVMRQIFSALSVIQQDMPIIFPMHPRTRKMLGAFGLQRELDAMNVIITEPLGYLPFLRLMSGAKLVLTDSGGIQEETTFLKIPCLTMRENTERPITVTMGTNQLVGMNPDDILAGYRAAMNGALADAQIPPLWDGQAAQRIVEILEKLA